MLAQKHASELDKINFDKPIEKMVFTLSQIIALMEPLIFLSKCEND